MDSRKIASFAVMCAFMAMNAATSKPRGSSTSSGSTPPPPTFTSTPTPTTNSAPADLDIFDMRRTLNCASKTVAGCRLLNDFEFADVWTDVPTSNTTFYGEINGIGGNGDGQKEFFFLQVEAAPGRFEGSAKALLTDTKKDRDDCNSLLFITKGGGSAPFNSCSRFLKERPPGTRKLLRTVGRSHTLEGQFVWIRKSGNRMLLVEYQGGGNFNHGPKSNFAAGGWVGELFLLR